MSGLSCFVPIDRVRVADEARRFEPGVDDDPGLRIGGDIRVGSKAPWYEIAGNAPRFEEGVAAPGVRSR